MPELVEDRQRSLPALFRRGQLADVELGTHGPGLVRRPGTPRRRTVAARPSTIRACLFGVAKGCAEPAQDDGFTEPMAEFPELLQRTMIRLDRLADPPGTGVGIGEHVQRITTPVGFADLVVVLQSPCESR